MALNDNDFSTKLQTLYNEMAENPMSAKDYADKMSKLLDSQTKTADVKSGIAVAGGTVSGGSLVGCATSAKGAIE